MNGKLLTAALIVAAMAAPPSFAQQSTSPGNAATTPPAPSAPASPPAPAQPQAATQHPEHEGWHHGGWRHHGWGHEGMMHPGMMGEMMPHHMRWAHYWRKHHPRRWCLDRVARRAGRMASVGVRLDLTPQQRPLWDKLENIARDAEQKAQQLCNTFKPDQNRTLIARLDRRQQALSLKLSSLQAAKPALAALYQALTPEQRAILDHPHHRH